MDSMDAEYIASIVEDRSRIKQENKRLRAKVTTMEYWVIRNDEIIAKYLTQQEAEAATGNPDEVIGVNLLGSTIGRKSTK